MPDSLPVGSVAPYAGPTPSSTIIVLDGEGWLLCDGSQYPIGGGFAELFAAIKYAHGGAGNNFHVPDLRGQFVRGVNGTAKLGAQPVDPDADERTAPDAGGNTGNKVGSKQAFATASPKKAMTSSETGSHTHTLDHLPCDYHKAYAGSLGRTGANYNAGSPALAKAGLHTHGIDGGGDAETRPVNVGTYWIIKFKSN